MRLLAGMVKPCTSCVLLFSNQVDDVSMMLGAVEIEFCGFVTVMRWISKSCKMLHNVSSALRYPIDSF